LTTHNTITSKILLLHAEIRAIMFDKRVNLTERFFVEKKVNSFTSRQLVFFMLCVDSGLASS